MLGPGGFHRHFTGNIDMGGDDAQEMPEVRVGYDASLGNLYVVLHNASDQARTFELKPNAYFTDKPTLILVGPRSQAARYIRLHQSGHWYDYTVCIPGQPGFSRRFAGRVETGRPSISDPVMGGKARGEQLRV